MPLPSFPTTYTDARGQTAYLPPPKRPIPTGIRTNTLVLQFDSGHEQRRKKSDPVRTWELTYENLTTQAYQALENFFVARQGQVGSFTWTHPVTSTQYVVRFDGDNWQASYDQTTNQYVHLWGCSFKLIQVL